MSGHVSNHPPVNQKGALNRLSLACVFGWALLIAASLAVHSHDGVGSARLAAPVAQGAATAADS